MGKDIQGHSFIVYPDSVGFDVSEVMGKLTKLYPCALSPLHDKDINPDGTTKKAHYHFYAFCRLTKKQLDSCKVAFGYGTKYYDINIYDAKNAYLYMAHDNKEEKAHYNIEDAIISPLVQFDALPTYQDKASIEDNLFFTLTKYVIDNNITSYDEYAKQLFFNQDRQLASFAFRHENKMLHLINSLREKKKIQSDTLSIPKDEYDELCQKSKAYDDATHLVSQYRTQVFDIERRMRGVVEYCKRLETDNQLLRHGLVTDPPEKSDM